MAVVIPFISPGPVATIGAVHDANVPAVITGGVCALMALFAGSIQFVNNMGNGITINMGLMLIWLQTR